MLNKFAQAFAFCFLIPAVTVFAANEKTKLTVAAAANLSSVAGSLMSAFVAANPTVDIDFVFGASGALTTQIRNGAPFHVFMAADIGFPEKIFSAGLAAGKPKIYARGRLALLSVKPRDFSAGLAVLTRDDVERIALANPETAPYGKASVQALTSAGLWDRLRGKIVTAQNISQAVQYALTAADFGFVNKSALYAKDLAAYRDKEGVNWIEVDSATHEPIDQAFVVLKAAENDPAALAFAAFLNSEAARTIFIAAGYGVAP